MSLRYPVVDGHSCRCRVPALQAASSTNYRGGKRPFGHGHGHHVTVLLKVLDYAKLSINVTGIV